MTKTTAQHSMNEIWNAVKSPQGKTALFWLLFYKRICDLWDEDCETRALSQEDSAGAPQASGHPFVVPETHSWSDLRKRPFDVGAKLAIAFHAIEEANPSLAGLLSRPDFSDREAFPDSTLQATLARMESLGLRASQMDDDAFGRLCEELAEKIAAEVRAFPPGGPSTPRQIARLLVEILQPQEGMSIYDGACGAGGMLIACYRHMRQLKKNAASLRFYGQEIDPDMWAVCRIIMLVLGVQGAMIEKGDTLRNPRHLAGDGRTLMSFDRVITHPPFSLREWGFDEWSQGDAYGRGDYGIPPKSCADLAFLEHSIASLNSKGMLGTVAPQGILFRTREEGEIRRRILQDDLVEAVVGLAPDVFSSSLMPACLLILNKAKPKERREKVLIVDGGEESSSGASRNSLSNENVVRIESAFRTFEDQEQFSRVVSLREIERNGFTLSISRYVQTRREEPVSHLAAEWQTLLKLISERNEAERKMADYIKRLEQTSDDA
jgi:type I restriction enzyme M protein